MLEIGQHVVCVDDDWGPCSHRGNPIPVNAPMEGCVYTIADFHINSDKDLFLVLEGINPLKSWWVRHFRPVKKTDISELTARLNPTKEIGRV